MAPRLPVPSDSGAKIRTFNLIKQLSVFAKVTLLTFDFEGKKRVPEALQELGIDTVTLRASEKTNPFFLFSKKPFSIRKYYSIVLCQKIRELIVKDKYDLVHFDHIHTAQYINDINDIPSVIDEHNIEFKILERCVNPESNIFKKLIFKQQASKMSKFEASIATEASCCLTVSELDKVELLKLAHNNVKVEIIPNGVDTDYFSSAQKTDNKLLGLKEDALVFTGSMDWLPNSDAVEYFCADILPLIWQKKPETKFYVVGKNPPEKIKKLGHKDKRIIITGMVSDVRPFIIKSKVFVVPLRIGGGTRLKILEALSMQKAVVSTTIGAEGIDIIDGRHILLADKPKDFSNKVISLLEDLELTNNLGKQGRKLVLEKYDWQIIGKSLLEIYRQIISNYRASDPMGNKNV